MKKFSLKSCLLAGVVFWLSLSVNAQEDTVLERELQMVPTKFTCQYNMANEGWNTFPSSPFFGYQLSLECGQTIVVTVAGYFSGDPNLEMNKVHIRSYNSSETLMEVTTVHQSNEEPLKLMVTCGGDPVLVRCGFLQ